MPVDVSEVTSRAEPDLNIGDFDSAYIAVKIADAEAIIEAELPIVATRLESGALKTQLYNSVVADMVLRVLRNPEGYTYRTAGDESASASGIAAAGQIVIDENSSRRLTGVIDGAMPSTSMIGGGGWGLPGFNCAPLRRPF